jgi:hypothetical protein
VLQHDTSNSDETRAAEDCKQRTVSNSCEQKKAEAQEKAPTPGELCCVSLGDRTLSTVEGAMY